jgi:membrane protein YqaA with SNARE-associated domain
VIYLSLFAVGFIVATIIPFGSEVYFAYLLAMNQYNGLLLLIAASLGNVLGSVFNWICGYYANNFINKKWFPIKKKHIDRASRIFDKYGKWSLLLGWVPFIGDPITFVAGTFRYSFLSFLLLVSIGKVGRYIFVYFSVIWAINIF